MKQDSLFDNFGLTDLLLQEMEKCSTQFVHPILIPEKGKALVCTFIDSNSLKKLPIKDLDLNSVKSAQIAIVDQAIFYACQFIFKNTPNDKEVHDFLESEMMKSIKSARTKLNLQAFCSEEIHLNSLEEAEEIAKVIKAKLAELRIKRG